MEQKEKQILCDIQSNEKKQQADLLKVKKQMEEQRDKATQSLQELQMMRGQTDSFLFLRVSRCFWRLLVNEYLKGALFPDHSKAYFYICLFCRNLSQ